MKTFSRILWLIFSLLTIAMGIGGLFIPLELFASLIILLPWLLLCGALSNVIYYFYLKDKNVGDMNILLIDALLSVLFAIIFFVSGIFVTGYTVIMFIAFMAMFKGIIGLYYMFKYKKQGADWVWLLISSILSIIIAIIFILFPGVGGLTTGFMIAFMVLWFGIISLLAWFGIKKIDKISETNE